MAKARATCRCETCGKEFEKTAIKQNRRDADSWETWAASYYDECDECREKRIMEEREAVSKAASENAKEIGLPTLIGSEKQVAWAETIRMEGLESLQAKIDQEKELAASGRERHVKRYDDLVEFQKWILTKDEARFWIDNRSCTYDGRVLWEQLRDAFRAEYIPEDIRQEIEKETAQPVIVEPVNKTSSVVCEVSATENEVTVKSLKDQGVIDIVKASGYKWNGSVWHRSIDIISGSSEDRLVEIGNRLLVAGYPVKADPAYHDRIISGDYEPESKRWIIRESDKIRILTGKNEDLEKKARKIYGASKYGKIIVPSSAWEEIMDFARIHDFKISPGAKEAMDAYKASVVTVSPTKGAEAEYHEENTRNILESSRDVLDDLREEE